VCCGNNAGKESVAEITQAVTTDDQVRKKPKDQKRGEDRRGTPGLQEKNLRGDYEGGKARRYRRITPKEMAMEKKKTKKSPWGRDSQISSNGFNGRLASWGTPFSSMIEKIADRGKKKKKMAKIPLYQGYDRGKTDETSFKELRPGSPTLLRHGNA